MPQAASNQPHRYELPPEPFGQRGVRQYFGRASTAICLLVMFIAIGMLARSHFVVDVIAKVQDDRLMEIRSVYGRLLVYSRPFTRAEGDPRGWLLQSYPMPGRIRDPWAPGWQKTLGFEVGRTDLAGQGQPGWWWMRLKWSTVAVLASLLPVSRAVQNRSGQRRVVGGSMSRSSGDDRYVKPVDSAPVKHGVAANR